MASAFNLHRAYGGKDIPPAPQPYRELGTLPSQVDRTMIAKEDLRSVMDFRALQQQIAQSPGR
jgi:hypothetical protein